MKKLTATIVTNEGTQLFGIDGNILSVNFGALDRGDISDTTNWGVFSNKGELAFVDVRGDFKSSIHEKENMKVCIYYRSEYISYLLATFLIDDYDYNEESKQVTLTLKDSLIDLQQKSVEQYYTFIRDNLHNACNDVFEGYGLEFGGNAENVLKDTKINTMYMKSDSVWSNLDKICQATMLRCFCGENGMPVLSDETPKQQNNIIIRPRNILSIENRIRNSKTVIKSVSISAPIIGKHENVPLADESVPFVWYKISYSGSLFVPVWANYFTNCTTSRYTPTGKEPDTGASVTAQIRKPENLQNMFGNMSVIVEVNEARQTLVDGVISRPDITKLSTKDKTYERIRTEIRENVYDQRFLEAVAFDDSAYSGAIEGEDGILTTAVAVTEGTINILGNYFTEDGERTYGGTGDFAVKLKGNELIQTQSTYQNKFLAFHLKDTVENKYQNGVECVEIEVTPSDYYDIDGEKVIDSISGIGVEPVFKKYDIVTPYVIRNGVERPYSTKDDGTAKSFKVMGVEYFYKGFLRQKLYLQENV